MTLQELVDVVARRGSLDVINALEGPALPPRSLEQRLSSYAPSVVAQRLSELTVAGVVETVPETGQVRLSAAGRRLQGLLDQLARWAQSTS